MCGWSNNCFKIIFKIFLWLVGAAVTPAKKESSSESSSDEDDEKPAKIQKTEIAKGNLEIKSYQIWNFFTSWILRIKVIS